MFMVLILHANFVALGKPTTEDLGVFALSTVFRWLIEAVSISSVNAFVLISGWFGIKSSFKGALKFIYQILFFLGISFVVALCLGVLESPIHAVLDVFQLTPYDWFIKSYFVLMILAPLLNQFKTLEVATQRNILLLFFGFEAVYGWVAGGSRFFVSGYGPLHLMGIYLLGQYLHSSLPFEDGNHCLNRICKRLFNFGPVANLMLYLLCSAMIAVMGLVDLKMTGGTWVNTILAYSSPLVVLAAVFLFLTFVRMEVKQSNFINWLGASSFAVYLLHGDPIIRHKLFIPIIQEINSQSSGLKAFLFIGVFLVALYLLACLVDQIRIITWSRLSRRLS